MAVSLRRGKIGSRNLGKLLGSKLGGAAVGSGVTAEESVGTTRTVIRFSAKAIPLLDAAAVVAYAGLKIYDFPDGNIRILDAVANLDITKSSAGVNADFDGDFGVGTVTASNNATLASTEQNVIPTTPTPQAVAGATTAKGRQAADIVALDGTGTAVDLFLNLLVDDADHDVTTTPCNLIVNGTITIVWCTAGDF